MLFSRQESNAASGSRAITICSGLVGDPKPAWVIIKQIKSKGYSCSIDRRFCHFLGEAPGVDLGCGHYTLKVFLEPEPPLFSYRCEIWSQKLHETSYSLSQIGWDTLGSPCPLNVGVQDLVTEPPWTTLRGTRGALEGKKQRLVKESQLFLSETVSGRNLKACWQEVNL